MVISNKFTKAKLLARHNELVEQLQAEAQTLFYDRMMYDINDSLTSILAVCEIEPKEAIPKIKQYIHRINQSLHTTKNYQNSGNSEKKFNITLVTTNLIRVIKENFKDARLTSLISDIKAPVQGDQSKFEQLLLHVFVNMFAGENIGESEILIELRQKDENAMITMLKDNHVFSEEVLKQIDEFQEKDDFKGRVRITPQGKGVEVIIKIPLQFKVVIGDPVVKTPSPDKNEPSRKVNVVQRKAPKLNTWPRASGLATPGLAF